MHVTCRAGARRKIHDSRLRPFVAGLPERRETLRQATEIVRSAFVEGVSVSQPRTHDYLYSNYL